MNFLEIIAALLAYDIVKGAFNSLAAGIKKSKDSSLKEIADRRRAHLDKKIQKLQAEKNVVTLMEERANG